MYILERSCNLECTFDTSAYRTYALADIFTMNNDSTKNEFDIESFWVSVVVFFHSLQLSDPMVSTQKLGHCSYVD